MNKRANFQIKHEYFGIFLPQTFIILAFLFRLSGKNTIFAIEINVSPSKTVDAYGQGMTTIKDI
jgi:hypothetical protein